MMGVVGVAVHYLMVRAFPTLGIGRLITALDSPSEDASMAAYIALVKLGPRHAEKLLATAHRGEATCQVLQILGDLGDATLIPKLDVFTRSEDVKVIAAAREAIKALRADTAGTSLE